MYAPSKSIYSRTVPVATAVVCNTTFSCALMGLRSNLDIKNPIRADCRDILNVSRTYMNLSLRGKGDLHANPSCLEAEVEVRETQETPDEKP